VVSGRGLRGRLDARITWDPSEEGAFLEALRSQTGLEVKKVRRKTEVLVVR